MDNTTRFNAQRMKDAYVNEFNGLCLGVIADGAVNKSEADFLTTWLESRIAMIDDPLVIHVYKTLQAVQQHGLTPEYEAQLLDLLTGYTGATSPEARTNKPTTLPLDNPPPELEFADRHYVFTGTFDFGKRADCEGAAKSLGAKTGKDVRLTTDYLVIGNHATESWAHESYGRKISKAMEFREKYRRPAIISEAHFVRVLESITTD